MRLGDNRRRAARARNRGVDEKIGFTGSVDLWVPSRFLAAPSSAGIDQLLQKLS